MIGGCRTNYSASNKAGLPPSGQVRIVATKISDTSEKVAWEWTIIGERNWSTVELSELNIRLSKTYPMNDKTITGGTHLWLVDVVVTKSLKLPGTADIKVDVRGSDGASTYINLSVSMPVLRSNVIVKVQDDRKIGLPAGIDLATLGRLHLRLDISK